MAGDSQKYAEGVEYADGVFRLPAAWTRRPVRVSVIGAGGSGSEVIDALARLDYALIAMGGQGLSITLWDGDTVSPSNVGRQRFLHCDVGLNKADVLAERYGMLMGTQIESVPSMFDIEAAFDGPSVYRQPTDLLISCVDRASVRVEIGQFFRRRRSELLWMDLGNGAHTGQVVLGHAGMPDGPRLPNVWDLYPSLAEVDDHDEPSCSLEEAIRHQRLGVNRFMADTAVFTLLAPLMQEGVITSHGAFIDMRKPSIGALRIERSAWSFLGFDPEDREDSLAA